MFSTNTREGYAAVALIQSSLAGAMAASAPLVCFKGNDGASLVRTLHTGESIPRNLVLDFSPLLDVLRLQMLSSDPSLQNIVAAISGPGADLSELFEDGRPGTVFNRVRDFFGNRHELASLAALLGPFLDGQFTLALALIATFKHFASDHLPHAICDAVLDYFLGQEGFLTVDELHIAPPMQVNGPAIVIADNGLLDKTGQRYVRDLVAVTVEMAGDIQYRLRDRCPRLLAHLSPAQRRTVQRWFKGFASMAESGVIAAVEETLLGLSQFAANPLIFVAARAYAGTAARKATQHVFLSEFGF